jgi:hypothetical protein
MKMATLLKSITDQYKDKAPIPVKSKDGQTFSITHDGKDGYGTFTCLKCGKTSKVKFSPQPDEPTGKQCADRVCDNCK